MANMAMMLSEMGGRVARGLTIGPMGNYQSALGSSGMYISISAGHNPFFT